MRHRQSGQARKHIDIALRVAGAIDHSHYKAMALSYIARALAEIDPARSRSLCTEALGLARRLPITGFEKVALRDVAVAMAIVEPRQAMQLAQKLTAAKDKAGVLKGVAVAIGRSNLTQARNLYAEAIPTVRGIKDPIQLLPGEVTGELAAALARTDFPRALAEVTALSPPFYRADALSLVAASVVGSDPTRGKALFEKALAMSLELDRKELLNARIAVRIARTDPPRALAVARQLESPPNRAESLGEVAAGFARTDPNQARSVFDQALEAAEKVTKEKYSETYKDVVLKQIAIAMAASDPERALMVLGKFSSAELRVEGLAEVCQRVAASPRIGTTQARKLLAQAIDLVKDIQDPFARGYYQVLALGEIACAFAGIEPKEAQSLCEQAFPRAKAIVVMPYRAESLSRLAAAAALADDSRALELLAPVTDKRLAAYARKEMVKSLVR